MVTRFSRSRGERRSDGDRLPPVIRRAGGLGTAIAMLVFAAVATGARPAALLERGPFTSDFFDAQAHALLDGRLDVDADVAGIEGFRHDGQTHLYFGLFPAVLRLPVAAVTDDLDGRLTNLSMLGALAVACAAATRLVWRARRWRRGDGPPERHEALIVGVLTAVVGAASPLLFLASRPIVYHETELWGTATTLVALELVLRWWEGPSARRLAVASLVALVALNTRASVGGGAVAALALTAGLAIAVRRVDRRAALAAAAAVLVPIAAYAGVNMARFDHPFRIPFDEQVHSGLDPARQATLEATDGTLFGLEFAPTALVTYLRPDGVELQRLFPWITFREDRDPVGDATFDTIDRAASLPVVTPALLLLAAVGLVAAVRCGRREPWLAAAAGSSAGLVATITIAFIAHRYLADFTAPLTLLAAIGTWITADRLAAASRPGRLLGVAGLVALALIGTGTSVALALQSQRLFILPTPEERRDFVATQHAIGDVLLDGRPPGVRAAAEAGEPGPRGEIVIVDRCRALYWSDGARWWPLELGGRDGLQVTASGDEPTLLRGAGWSVVVDERGDEARLRYVGAQEQTGDWVARARVSGELHVALDRVNAELTVGDDDGPLLVAWLVDLSGPVRAPGANDVRSADTPLCADLLERLGG